MTGEASTGEQQYNLFILTKKNIDKRSSKMQEICNVRVLNQELNSWTLFLSQKSSLTTSPHRHWAGLVLNP